ncbi:tripartite tricarboxylate transporter TctB family protein [Natrialbaceae archaeon AArc-T1-2]|uniref:tripartite tricarboxylate transporter TctB family protein n=1 Tax=Natrialbaceae archaeon AArc-T1-2 TaxID=3053904 RepID=UPI00255B328D|nr:tripartite tricarboxylate transporter TctB family protein [Natrialbaceae archaeon AArc-T1-2]WIV65916.1 tripartite tricarboxylate transporter TctB family protein [Natrialbaceae archaeon AArc-T1-2]
MQAKSLEPPTVDLRLGERQVRIDTGELLFPLIALVFCALYYWDTRGLPEQSMLYANPLLYATILLAVVTLLIHVISITPTSEEAEPGTTQGETPEDGPSGSTDGGSNTSETAEEMSPDGNGSYVETSNVDGATEQRDHSRGRTDVVEQFDETERTAETDQKADGSFTVRTAAGITALSLVYVGLLYVEVPFTVSSVGFLAASLYMFGERRPTILIAYSVGFTILVWGVFINWLNLPLP